MSTLTEPRGRDVRRLSTGAMLWFGAMVGGWLAFFALVLFSPETISELWRDVRGLPLVVEALVWLATFPFVLAIGVWETAWPDWTRLALVATFAVGWSFAFLPRPKTKEDTR